MQDTQLYLWVKTFHIVFMVTWFSGLFYLPRLFVYHATTADKTGYDRFLVMESKLYYAITYPGGVLTSALGLFLLYLNPALLSQKRVILKLSLVAVLWCYHVMCGYYYKRFSRNENSKSHVYFRFFNEFSIFRLFYIFQID